MGRVLNLKGSVFGRLTAVECVGKDKSNRALWRCVCECGNEKMASIPAHFLSSRGRRSASSSLSPTNAGPKVPRGEVL